MFYMLMLVVSIFYYPKTKILKGERSFLFQNKIFYKTKKILQKYEIIWNVEN